LNQSSLLNPDLEKMFFAPRPKIVLQQNRHKADMLFALSDVRFWG
jgi:hypothetical protein